jgi:hypothetical protein
LKKLVGILATLVIVLGGLLIFEYLNDYKEESKEREEDKKVITETVEKSTKEETKEQEEDNTIIIEKKEESTESNKTYQFQDIESMEKAQSVGEARDKFFGTERLVKIEDIYKEALTDSIERPVILAQQKEYYKEKPAMPGLSIPFFMKPGFDSRMEMIDFLHYIQCSGLTENAWGKPYYISMSVYQSYKSGVELPEPHQGWGISTEKLKVMDFSDKETMLEEIHLYGDFTGINPSGTK